MKFNLIIGVFFLFLGANAQESGQLKTYDHKYQDGQTLKVYADNGLIALTAYQPNIVKVTYLKTDQQQIDSSDVVTAKPIETKVRVTQNLDDIFMTTDSLIIIINKLDFSIKFEKRNEKLLSVNTAAFNIQDSIKTIDFSLEPEEDICRFKKSDFKTYNKSHRLQNRHKENLFPSTKEKSVNISIPLFYSNKGFGIFFDNKAGGNSGRCKTKANTFQYSTQRGHLSYYFIAGNKEVIISSVAWLTQSQAILK